VYNALNEGVFFYMSNSDSLPLTLTLSLSTITCKSSTTGFSLTPIAADYYSVFYVRKNNQDITFNANDNVFANCFTAANGGIYNLDSGTSASVAILDTLSSFSYSSS